MAERVIEEPEQVPIAFQMEYNLADIDPRFTYAVRASITEGGDLAFTTDTVHPVITAGNPNQVDLVLVKVAASQATPAPTEPAATEPAPSEPGPDEMEMVDTPAPIEEVKVEVSDSVPPRYTLNIVSGLPGGCAKFHEYATSIDGNTIAVTVTNLVPAEPVPCTAIYDRHEGEVDLGDDLAAGETYTVIVNGQVTNGFTVRDDQGRDMAEAASPSTA